LFFAPNDPRQPPAMTAILQHLALRSDGRTHRDRARMQRGGKRARTRSGSHRVSPAANGVDPDHKVAMPGNLVATDF
jgi:hypothetical protein